MHDSQSVRDASPLIKRQSRREWEYNSLLLDIVFRAENTEHLQQLLKDELYSLDAYKDLPKFRLIALEAFLRGALEAIAKMEGTKAPQIALEKPRTRVKDRSLSQKIDELKTHSMPNSPTRPVPGWASNAPRAVKQGRAILDKMIAEADAEEVPSRLPPPPAVPRRREVVPPARLGQSMRPIREESAEVSIDDARREPKTNQPPQPRFTGQRRLFRARRLR